MVWPLTLALAKCAYLPYLRPVSLMTKIYGLLQLIIALAIELSCFNTSSLHTDSFSLSLFSLLKHYLKLYIPDTALKVFRSVYCFTTSISHGVENYFPSLWGSGISDAIFSTYFHCTSWTTFTVFQAQRLTVGVNLRRFPCRWCQVLRQRYTKQRNISSCMRWLLSQSCDTIFTQLQLYIHDTSLTTCNLFVSQRLKHILPLTSWYCCQGQ